jgi:uncharacterized protein YndB with AHSA1/START domain
MTEPAPPDDRRRSPTAVAEPVRRAVTVRTDRDHCFDAFTRRLGEWWPLATHALRPGGVASVVFERRLGGQVYETYADGGSCPWGEVIEWRPPEKFAITWDIAAGPGGPTEVHVEFRALGPALTRVELEHRHWERLAEESVRREGYDGPNGWTGVLARYVAYAERGDR